MSYIPLPKNVAGDAVLIEQKSGTTIKLDDSTPIETNVQQPVKTIKNSLLIEGFEAITGITGSTDVSNIATSVQHIGIGTKSIQFDKSGTTQAYATVEKTITSVDLTAYTAHYSVEFQIYLSTLVDVASVQVSIGTDSSNYISWSTDGEFLVAGWNTVTKGLNYPEVQVGNGIDYSAVTWVAITTMFDAVGDTLTGIRVDNIELHSADTHSLEEIAEKSGDFWLDHAIALIQSTYGDEVSVGVKNKDLIKFGRNELVGTSPATIMTLPVGEVHETYVASDLINSIISDNAADTQDVIIEGHTLSGTDYTFVVQSATLTGTTVVALTTPLTRVSRVYNDDTTELLGNIYVTETDTYTAGVPNTATKVHLTVPAGKQQSKKAATTTSSIDYWIVSGFYIDLLEKGVAFASADLQIRLFGKVFRDSISIATSGSHSTHEFKPYLIVPKNADVRLVATADGASTDVSGGIQGVLAKII